MKNRAGRGSRKSGIRSVRAEIGSTETQPKPKLDPREFTRIRRRSSQTRLLKTSNCRFGPKRKKTFVLRMGVLAGRLVGYHIADTPHFTITPPQRAIRSSSVLSSACSFGDDPDGGWSGCDDCARAERLAPPHRVSERRGRPLGQETQGRNALTQDEGFSS